MELPADFLSLGRGSVTANELLGRLVGGLLGKPAGGLVVRLLGELLGGPASGLESP